MKRTSPARVRALKSKIRSLDKKYMADKKKAIADKEKKARAYLRARSKMLYVMRKGE